MTRKYQRSVHLPESIIGVVDDYESRTGARLSRQVLAGLLQFFFGQQAAPEKFWMGLAVSLERGEVTIADIVAKANERFGD